MFTPEQKRFVYENSVKVNDNKKYLEIMGHYQNYFERAKRTSIKRKIGFICILLVVAYIVCRIFLFQPLATSVLVFRGATIFVGALIVFKIGMMLLNYIDDMPIIKKIQNKECDLLCYTGDLNDVSKSINYSTSSDLQNYFMIVSGNKFQIDRKNYKIFLQHKGKKIYIYYFPELLTRQLLITDASVILIEQ
jgi:hypothetical protein